MGEMFGMQTLNQKIQYHWQQCTITGRFQEFADDWTKGDYEAPLTKLEDIKRVPITTFIAENDTTCSP